MIVYMCLTAKMSRPCGTVGVMKNLSPKMSVFSVVSGWQVCIRIGLEGAKLSTMASVSIRMY